MPLVSINIPCYRQLHYFRECLATILAQTFTDYEVNVLDDGDDDSYRDYIESLADARLRYRRNETRLGAMRNMFQAISAGEGKYTLAFHEDDLLAPDYIRSAVEILESRSDYGFVAAEMREFETDAPPSLSRIDGPLSCETYEGPAAFLRGILEGVEPMFGSVIYRRSALNGIAPDHVSYGTLVDRPFLMSILENWSAAVIRNPLAWYRHHERDGDARHMAMTAEHVLHLLDTYRSKLPATLTKEDHALFYSYSGYWLFELYRLTPPEQRPPVWKFLFQAWRRDLYDPRARGRFGVRQIQRALLNQPS